MLGGDLAHLAGEVCPLLGDVEFLCASVVRRGLTRDQFVIDHLVDQPAHGGAIAHDELRDDRGPYSWMAVDKQQGGDLARSPGNIETFQAVIEIARKRYVDAADVEAQRVFKDIQPDGLDGIGWTFLLHRHRTLSRDCCGQPSSRSPQPHPGLSRVFAGMIERVVDKCNYF
ncbi:hypothetical protein AJ88_11660 [Mesorhizobium amorphae CCBAU 01583]|nr:hypothetical protein AJ88_11660 [Mesorhizobium amorphae CCBAU 01583]